MRRLLAPAFACLVAAGGVLPAVAPARATPQRSAATADRNRDRIPDRWERRHGLSLRVKQTWRDPDRDGLSNLGEYRAGTNPRNRDTDGDRVRDGAEVRHRLNPRSRDTDGDGIRDGDEMAGRIVRFRDGILTMSLAVGGTVSGHVTATTEIQCPPAPVRTARLRVAEEDPAAGDGWETPADEPDVTVPVDGGDPVEGDVPVDGDDPADGDDPPAEDGGAGDPAGDGAAAQGPCSTADLVVGALVGEASLELADGGAVFRAVELLG